MFRVACIHAGSEGECLDEIDSAREAAGLAKFVQPTQEEATKRLPLETTSNAWDPLCKDLLNVSFVLPARSLHDATFVVSA